GEIALPALQPGSSIMPGKVNPVIPESVAQVAAQVQGNDLVVAVAVGSGNFQLNVMFPVLAKNLLESIGLLAAACRILGQKALDHTEIKAETIAERLWKNPILATALTPTIGYERAAAIAKRAYTEGRSVLEVAVEDTGMDEDELRRLMDPSRLASGG
ncbi:aspartate ammonia-lyase, partial [bacterium]|nr:aspartate ammonia-lyase [bacterium]